MRFRVSAGAVTLLGALLLLGAGLITGCSQDKSAPALVEVANNAGVTSGGSEDDPLFETTAAQTLEPFSDLACLECHTNQEQLVALAAPKKKMRRTLCHLALAEAAPWLRVSQWSASGSTPKPMQRTYTRSLTVPNATKDKRYPPWKTLTLASSPGLPKTR
ncbi:MAG: hypothetical protein HC915_07500 [Anaerolineae bacterium]|nr:hypothetical protein [Anaerolineae bacterium]